ncbi:hypothetical protein DXG01_005284, partial [Tephrocybe rancida]
MPESVSIAMYKGSTKSCTPSLALLIPPLAARSEVPMESNEGSMSEYLSMWKNIPHGITVIMFDEPLHASVECYHQHYNPQRDDDPLLQYGAVDSRLPGKSAEETIALRDAVIRWMQPHMDLVWETLPLAVADFKDHQVSLENISEYVCDDVHMYGLEAPELDEAAHIVLMKASSLPGVGKVTEVVLARASKTPELSKNKETGGPLWTRLKEAAQRAVNPWTDDSTKNKQQAANPDVQGVMEEEMMKEAVMVVAEMGAVVVGAEMEEGQEETGGDGGGGGDSNNGNGGEFRTAHDAAANNYVEEQWQVSCKINATSIPSWDGGGDTIIKYISAMARFARLGARVLQGLGQIAPQKWSGRALNWWDALPIGAQDYLVTNWQVMLVGLCYQFLDAKWLKDWTKEFEEM